jgi:hypothetical protein
MLDDYEACRIPVLLGFRDIKKEVQLSCFSGAGLMYFLNGQERFREG